mmetsp:Transcript_64042/g.195847  ORF Transcript_64042/g.195847 Transcript_64042/m.195847 type:complete len:250 (-) Transcript_64042:310-1059(-)
MPILLGDLLGARAERGRHVGGRDAKFRREHELDLAGAVLGVDGADVDADGLHVPLHLVAEVHELGVLQRGEDVDAIEERPPRRGRALALRHGELELAAHEQLEALAPPLLQLLQRLQAHRPGQRQVLGGAAEARHLAVHPADLGARPVGPGQALQRRHVRQQPEVRATRGGDLVREGEDLGVGAHGGGPAVHVDRALHVPLGHGLREGLAVHIHDLEAHILPGVAGRRHRPAIEGGGAREGRRRRPARR